MKQLARVLTATMVLVGSTQFLHAADDSEKLSRRLENARTVVNEIVLGGSPDKQIPQSILSRASCVVVVPAYKKAAFVVGGQYGQGVATCRTGKGWSAPVFVQLTGGSFGFQIGGQSTDLVLIAMNHDGLQHMLSNKFKLGGDAAASIGPLGRNAQAGTDWKLNAEFLTYSHSKGLFGGLDLDGTVLSQNEDDTRAEYGANISFKDVLAGSTPTPVGAKPFVRSVAKAFVSAQ